MIDAEVETLQSEGREREAESLLATKKSKFLMAAAGYNAGSGHTYALTPKEAYVSDNTAWIAKMYRPPYVANARERIEKQCSPADRAAADKRKLVAVNKTFVEKVKGKRKKIVRKVKPHPGDVKCSKEWLKATLNSSRIQRLAQDAEHKWQEVRPYVKWIDVCMSANPSQRPPMKGKSLTDPKYLEQKNAGCYPFDGLKPCPGKGAKK